MTTNRLITGAVAALALAVGACGDDKNQDENPGADGGPDASADAGADTSSEDSGTDTGTSTDAETDADAGTDSSYSYSVPLDPESPWPKFRRTAGQSGRSPVMPVDSGADLWVFETGKGIFSTPVIDGEDNVYIGSADRYFYALDSRGTLLWRELSGEIIDSSALLDDAGHIYYGSGDGFLYARDRSDGSLLWSFEADDPADTGAFINWFEGNVAMMPDGDLIVPNDNFCTYRIDRDNGEDEWCFSTSDQTWSLPAIDPETERFYIGNNFYFLQNIYGVDGDDGQFEWSIAAQGSVAASPMLTEIDGEDVVVVGAFDGIVRALSADDGDELWSFGTRDHIYASPGQLSDGTIIQPSADGTIYALNPADGSLVWAFDTREPIRSSPAIDGADNVYVGSGEGKLFVVNPDGTLRFSIQLIDDVRNDLNASPALGESFVAIAGESGEIFGVPYDYCLRDGLTDDRCYVGPEALDNDGALLVFTNLFGGLETVAPESIVNHQPLTFSLFVRESGDTELALIKSDSIDVVVSPNVPVRVDVSGDRRFLTLIPEEGWDNISNNSIEIDISGEYLVDLDREGLNFSGGTVGGSFDGSFEFAITQPVSLEFPLPVPTAPGQEAGIWELYRLAAPLPTILPSYNQIGFDSIHYLIGIVDETSEGAIAWGIGGTVDEDGNTVVDPASGVRFPMVVTWEGSRLELVNTEGFTIEFNGFPLPFDYFRVSTDIDTTGSATRSAFVNAQTVCGEIAFYGTFLQRLGYCNPDTDLLNAVGACEWRAHNNGRHSSPGAIGGVTWSRDADRIVATLADTTLMASDHHYSILLVDPVESRPLRVDYTSETRITEDEDGTIATISIPLPEDAPGEVDAYVIVDAYPVVRDPVGLAEL